MPINPDLAIGLRLPSTEFSWTCDDVIKYHLAVGAGAAYTDSRELGYVLGPKPCVLPTFGMTVPAALGVAAAVFCRPTAPEIRFPGLELNLHTLLHAGQEIVVHRPLEPSGTVRTSAQITDVLDKGSAAILVQESNLLDSADQPVLTFRSSIFAGGEGGFGGHRGTSASTKSSPPAREPDAVLHTQTLPQQALLYQLCGERNPVHTHPEHARRAGFPRPIMQGVCVFGMVCKTVVDALLGADPTRIISYSTRFASVVYPGETLSTSVWQTRHELTLQTSVLGRTAPPVLSNGRIIVS